MSAEIAGQGREPRGKAARPGQGGAQRNGSQDIANTSNAGCAWGCTWRLLPLASWIWLPILDDRSGSECGHRSLVPAPRRGRDTLCASEYRRGDGGGAASQQVGIADRSRRATCASCRDVPSVVAASGFRQAGWIVRTVSSGAWPSESVRNKPLVSKFLSLVLRHKPHRAAAQAAAHQIVAPGDDVGARDAAELVRPRDAGGAREVLHGALIGVAGIDVGEVGEPRPRAVPRPAGGIRRR